MSPHTRRLLEYVGRVLDRFSRIEIGWDTWGLLPHLLP
jgi:hypothetical protein